MQNAPAHDTALSDPRPVGVRADHDEPFQRDAWPASSTATQNVRVPHPTPVSRPGRVSNGTGALHVEPLVPEATPAPLAAVHPPDGTQATPAPLSAVKTPL